LILNVVALCQCVGAESDARCDLLCALGRATDPLRLRRALDLALDEGARPSDATALLFNVCVCIYNHAWWKLSRLISRPAVCAFQQSHCSVTWNYFYP
jgi:hypothetical protein